MIYRVIGTMSGSSLDGLDIAYCTIEEVGGKWSYTIEETACIAFSEEWKKKLQYITQLSAKELLLTHTAFGKWMGNAIHQFIEEKNLHHKVHLISSHGHTVFHEPQQGMTFQIGDGANISAITQLPVITDLRNMDVALQGQGAPIVPIGEKLFWNEYAYFLNLGGIANITIAQNEKHIAFDICPANRVLNLLANELGMAYDKNGIQASKGDINEDLLYELNELDYYKKPFPKSLANEFGTDVLFSIIQKYNISIQDKLHTMCEHISVQLFESIKPFANNKNKKLLVTGGGAFNSFLIATLQKKLNELNIEITVPNENLINYKEALVMALIGILRWREEENVMSSVTGAIRNSVGGALWMSN